VADLGDRLLEIWPSYVASLRGLRPVPGDREIRLRPDPEAVLIPPRHITAKVSYTVILGPPWSTGQPLALLTASSSESAVTIE
jgi:hypothetical protein